MAMARAVGREARVVGWEGEARSLARALGGMEAADWGG